MSAPAGQSRDLWHIFRLPLAIFVTSGIGLTVALLDDGWWHWVSWALLAIPPAVIAAAWVRQTRTD